MPRLQPYVFTKHAIRARNYRKRHPERVKEQVKQYREKNLEKVRAWNRKSRTKKTAVYRQRLDELKNKPCMDCGGCFPPECMDFDHVRGEKKFYIGNRKLASWDLLLEEIDKCDLICANCHRTRTRRRLNGKSDNSERG